MTILSKSEVKKFNKEINDSINDLKDILKRKNFKTISKAVNKSKLKNLIKNMDFTIYSKDFPLDIGTTSNILLELLEFKQGRITVFKVMIDSVIFHLDLLKINQRTRKLPLEFRLPNYVLRKNKLLDFSDDLYDLYDKAKEQFARKN